MRLVEPGAPLWRRALAILTASLALSLAALARAAVAAEPAPPPPAYDPLEGMDPSGRIPKVALPDDVAEPARWRYIPEGRLKPGILLQRHLVSSFVTPQVFFEQDVGAGGGLALTDIDFRDQRRQEFLGAFLTYTTEGQQK